MPPDELQGLREQVAALKRELRQSEDRFRSLITRNADAIVVVDGRGVVCFVNPAGETLFGRSAGQLLGTDFGFPLVSGETTELDLVGIGGEPRVVEMRVVETEWEGESALLAVLRDITDRKRAEEERAHRLREQAAREEAEQALRERDAFVAMASHELKTPIATLSASAQMLRRRIERRGAADLESLLQGLRTVEEQCSRLARLVSHLLDVSRINAGKLLLEREVVDLGPLVRRVVGEAQLRTRKHALKVVAPASLEARVDPLRFEQVISNLLDNAVKYSPDGGAVLVELSLVTPDLVRLAVRDHGLGIAPERRGAIFERFYQAHSESYVSGMGLGLFICRQIVELHGGTLGVDCPDDGGSQFVLSLPRGISAPSPETQPVGAAYG